MAAAQRITRIMQNIRTHLPGAIDSVIQLELYNVLDEFFKDSNIWTNDVSVAVTPTGGVNADGLTYQFDANDSAIVNRLMLVLDPNKIEIKASMQTPGVLVLNTAPSSNVTYTVTAALTCIDPVDSNNYPLVPDWVVDKYGLGLVDGVLGRMMVQPARPYTNEKMSIFHMRKFRDVVSIARQEARHKNLYRGQIWSYPQAFKAQRKRSW